MYAKTNTLVLVIPLCTMYSIAFESKRSEVSADSASFGNDVYSIQSPSDDIQRLTETRGTREEIRRPRSGSGPSLVLALGRSFIGTLAVAAFFKLWQDLLSFVSPQLLKYVRSYACVYIAIA